MAKTLANVVKVIVDSLSIMDTGSFDGVTAIAVATASGNSTFTCTGITATLNSLAGMDIVVFSGSQGPAIKTIASNTVTTGGSTVITITGTWAANPVVGAQAQIAPSATWVNIGLLGETALKIDLKNTATIPLSDGSELQKAYEMTLNAEALQLLDASVIEGYKNKTVWLKANPSGSGSMTAVIRNVLINTEASLDLSIKGKSGINLKATEYIQSITDAIVVA